jgi:hypothetical protein
MPEVAPPYDPPFDPLKPSKSASREMGIPSADGMPRPELIGDYARDYGKTTRALSGP